MKLKSLMGEPESGTTDDLDSVNEETAKDANGFMPSDQAMESQTTHM